MRCHLKTHEGTGVFHLASGRPSTGHNRWLWSSPLAWLSTNLWILQLHPVGPRHFGSKPAPHLHARCNESLLSFSGAGPARSTSRGTGPTTFSHLGIGPLWGFFAAVAIRSLQQQGLGNLKLQKQRDTSNSCLSCICFGEVKGGENASSEFFIMVSLGNNLIPIRKDRLRQVTLGRWANEKQCLSPKINLMKLLTWKKRIKSIPHG